MTVTPGQASAQGPESRGIELRAMSWNVGAEAEVERVAQVIREEGPDVVGLQEVHRDDDLPGGHGDQPSELAALLAGDGYRYTYYAATEVIPWQPDDGAGLGCATHAPADFETTSGGTDEAGTGDERAYSCGNMILSRFPLYTDPDHPHGPEHVTLPTENVDPDGRERRALLGVTAAVPGIGNVQVYNTHLGTPQTEAHVEDQQVQARTIVEYLDPIGGPMILLGDFNIRPTDTPTGPTANNLIHSWIAGAGLIDTWTMVNDSSDGVTMTSSYGLPDGEHPDRRIDYVFASPAWTVLDGHVSLVDADASDHLAVVMDLQLRRPPNQAHATALAGADGLSGWGKVALDRGHRVTLTACKNLGTDTDDGTVVRTSLHHPGTGETLREVTDGGTSRDQCTTEAWTGRVPSGATLRACLVREEEVLGCREETVGGA